MSDALVITIAHRLKTVIGELWLDYFLPTVSNKRAFSSDYDRVLVLDHGKVAEFDTPASLMSQEGSVFRSMCQRSADWDELSRVAAQHQPAE